MAFVAFIPRSLQTGTQWPQYLHSLYWTLSKPIFLFGLILTVLPTTLGFRYSFFNLILTPKIFHFIAKVSFCTYLVHLMIVFQVIHTRNYNFYYTTYEIFVYYAGILTLSLFFGTIVTVTVELPFGKLQKELMNYMKNRRKDKVKEDLHEHIISK
jgi:peptidoglycan/LPS O-acetylase OafA/YrhL